MKKIFILFLFVYSFAATYYVDKNPSCFLFWCTVCDGSLVTRTRVKDTIKEAVQASSDGDTIRICPDRYNESEIRIDKNLLIYSTTNNPNDVVVYDNSGDDIFIYGGGRENSLLRGISIVQESDANAVFIESGKGFEFVNLKIKSAKNGIWQEGGNFQKSEFDNIHISAEDIGIVTYFPERFILKNSKIYAKNWSFYAREPQGYIRLLESEFHSQNNAVWLGNQSQNYTISGCKFYTKNINAGGVSFYRANNFRVYDSYFNSDNKGSGIWINGTISGDFVLRDSYFENMKHEALYLKEVQGDIKILGNYFDTYSYGIRIKDCLNGKYIIDNILKNGDEYGLWLLDDFKWRSFDIYHNCFIDNERQANSRDRNADFDDGSIGNYWSDAGGVKRYEVPDVPRYDNFPQADCVILYNAFIDYHMDECEWDDDNTTYEIENFGSGGNDYNASAQNGADTVSDGVICRGGNIINDYYLIPKEPIELGKRYTINMWLKFPLNDNAHNDDDGKKYFNIADRNGSDYDFIYLTLTSSGNWVWVVGSGSSAGWNEFPDNLDGWHMLSFVANGNINKTKLYIDGRYYNKINNSITDDNLSILFNSDYDNGDGPYAQSIGGVVDEFKIFNRALHLADIMKIYLKEKDGYDYKGENRSCNICAPPTPLAEWRMDECSWDNDNSTYEIIDSVGSFDASAVNGADVTEGKICNGGDLNGSGSENNKYIELESYPELNDSWSFVSWIKFPLNPDNHIEIGGKNYFVISTVDGTGDLAYFAKDTSSGDFYFGVYDNSGNIEENLIDEPESGWHHIGIVSTGSQTILYVDAAEITRVNRYTKGDVNFIGTSTDSSEQETIGSVMDEVKLYDGVLSGGDIYDIYYEELNSNRDCPCNRQYKFDVWDTFRNETDRNISTKIVNSEFNLTLAEYNGTSFLDDFNGSVCSCLFDEENKVKIGDWNVTWWERGDDINETNISFNVNKAVKRVKVYIYWIENSYEDNSSCEGLFLHDANETNSTDNFAIRPKKFEFSNIPSSIIAGGDFNITIKAVDKNGDRCVDYNESVNIRGDTVDLEYNETKSNCLTGNLDKVEGGEFRDGEANITLKYSEVGDLNLTLKEINGSEFAIVDNDDTTDSERFIEEKSAVLSIGIHHFEVNSSLINFDRDNNFTYYDKDLNISGLLDINISAENEDNEIVANYNKECYAKDIDINISFNKVFYNENPKISKYKYYFLYADGSKSEILEENINSLISLNYKEGNFTTDCNGTTYLKVYINFDRNISLPSNPVKLNINELNVSNVSANSIGYTLNSGEAKFLYGNLLLSDVISLKDEFNQTFHFIVYDENESDILIPDSKEVVIGWFYNVWHRLTDGNVSESEIVVSEDYNSSNTISEVDVNIEELEDGNITFNIQRNSSEIKFAVIHLLTPNLKWLWYSKFGNEYNISSSSTCLNHFCFSVTWQEANEIGEIGSGEFNGTEANVTESNTTKTGVKIFR